MTCTNRNRQCGGYEDTNHDIFINLDQGTIGTSKKQLLNNARKERAAHKTIEEHPRPQASSDLVLRPASPLAISDPRQSYLRTKKAPFLREMTGRDFPEYVKSLWHRLSSEYSVTDDIWSVGVPHLLFQSKAFDLTAFALCTQRLSVSENDPKYQSMSLSAYSTALQSHRDHVNSNHPAAILAATSALLAFVEGAQPKGSHATYRIGQQGHFWGTIALMKACGPAPFQNPGYHEIFKKVRDMAVSLPAHTRASRSIHDILF